MSHHVKHHIRILHDTALHHAHAILGISHDHAHVTTNHHLIHHDHAHELVKDGKAEWVGIAPGHAPTREEEAVAAEGVAALGASGGI